MTDNIGSGRSTNLFLCAVNCFASMSSISFGGHGAETRRAHPESKAKRPPDGRVARARGVMRARPSAQRGSAIG